MVVERHFWEGRRVFVTGHTGFKGGWLSLWLQRLGARVTGYALSPPTDPCIFDAVGVAAGMVSHFDDIRDIDRLTAAMQNAEPEIVIHLAAQALVRDSYIDPIETYSTNVMGTVNVLEAVRNTPTAMTLLNITSDKCYDNKEWVWGYRENDRMGGFDPYSNSKGCAELVSAAYRHSFFQKEGRGLATGRAGNVIGGGDWAKDRIIPDAIRAFLHDEPLVVRNPLAIRPWQHVLEPLSGYLALCQKLHQSPEQFSGGWNFGPRDEDAQPVSVLADAMVKDWETAASWRLDSNEHPHEARHLKLDCSKAEAELEWQPVWPLQRALHETISWYKAWHLRQDMRAFTMDQIASFEKEAAGK